MFLFPLILSAALDMSLPEFQPELDASGNYIVGYVDENEEVVVEELEDLPASISSSPGDESLSPSQEIVYSTADASSNDAVVSAIENLNLDNNAYWELFLDSYPVDETVFLTSQQIVNPTFRFESNGLFGSSGAYSNDRFAYIPVSVGSLYSIYNIENKPTNGFRIGVVDDLENPTTITNFQVKNDLDDFSFYPSQNGYLVFMHNSKVVPSFQATYVYTHQESYTLSELGNAVMEIKESNSIKIRAILLVCLFNFLYPIAMNIVHNIVGGDHNV